MIQTDTTIAETDGPDDDSDLLPRASAPSVTPPAESIATELPAVAAPSEPPVVEPVVEEQPALVFISKESTRRGSTFCASCGVLHGRRDTYVVFELYRDNRLTQNCDACGAARHPELKALVDALNMGDDQDHGATPPYFVVDPVFGHERCGANCACQIESHRVWPVLHFPNHPTRKHAGVCRRCWETKRFKQAMPILCEWLGLAPLPPIAPPPPPPAPTEAEIAAVREARHHGIVADIIASCQPGWTGGNRYTPDPAAQALIALIDERIDAALAAEGVK